METSTDMFWGGLIRELREKQSLSQRKLADLASVNRSTLRKIELGRTSATVSMMERILNCLGHELEAMARVNLNALLIHSLNAEQDSDRQAAMAAKMLLFATRY